MATIEQGKNTSFQWGRKNMRVIENHGLQNSSPSSVINRGIDLIDDAEELKDLKSDWREGNATLGEIISKIEEL